LKPDDPAQSDSNQALLGRVGRSSFFLNVQNIEENEIVSRALSRIRPDRANIHYQPLAIAAAWDALFFVRHIELDEIIIPHSHRKSLCDSGKDSLAGVAGVYNFVGVFDFPETLVIELENGKIFTDSPNSDGELFPPHRSELVSFSDSEFGWHDWPMTLKFERDDHGIAVSGSVHFPTMPWVFCGERAL
jgi:hypothetical protein